MGLMVAAELMVGTPRSDTKLGMASWKKRAGAETEGVGTHPSEAVCPGWGSNMGTGQEEQLSLLA